MPAGKTAAVNALQLLTEPEEAPLRSVCVLVGDDAFLQHEARRALLERLSPGEPHSAEVCNGPTVELSDVLDRLMELSLFSDERRIVVVEDADKFVKQYRPQLENYVANPREESTFILEVSTWPGTTRLAKAVARSGLTVHCSVPAKGREVSEFVRQLKSWLAAEVKKHYGCQLLKSAADRLLELLPTQPGVLLQEAGRLALLAGDAKKIDATLVSAQVGSWRTRKTWDMIDAAAAGRTVDALEQLDRLMAAGEDPHALLPQMASTLRRFPLATRIYEEAEARSRRISLRDALARAGVPSFKLGDAEQQLRQIGRHRAQHLSHWLLDADLALKSYNSHRDRGRRVLETLIVKIGREARGGR